MVFLTGVISASAEESSADFENVPAELPGWSATISGEGAPAQYRPAAKWDVPFSISLDGDKPRGGSVSLKTAFSEDVPGMVSLRPPDLAVSGPAARIQMFVRSEGLLNEPFLSFEESSADGRERIKSHWMAVKIPAIAEWTEVTWSGTLQPATASLRISLVLKSPSAGAQIWMDDLVVESIQAE